MDMRVYNGCPNDELQKYLDKVQKLEEILLNKFPESCVTYFPVEQKWQVHEWGNPLSKFHTAKIDAILEALKSEK
jgi:hypothetical protein